jgi:tetratricopeptide (TPR) repeat protein
VPYQQGQHRATDFIEHVTEIVDQVKGYADVGDREMVRAFALHAADFLEVTTSDRFAAMLLWQSRATILTAVYRFAQTSARKILEQEIVHSLQTAERVAKRLDADCQRATWPFILRAWWYLGNKFLGQAAYEQVVALARRTSRSLDLLDKLYYGLACHRLGDHRQAVNLLGKILGEAKAKEGSKEEELLIEARVALARSRVLLECPQPSQCARRWGPFAPYIYAEVVDRPVQDFWHLGQPDCGERMPEAWTLPRAFVDGNLVVMEQTAGSELYTALVMHEAQHSLKRLAGQQLRTETGRWLSFKRDVPVASAQTYLMLLTKTAETGAEKSQSGLGQFLDIGRRCAANRKKEAHQFIQNMLLYFDDLAPRETRASYPCAAILLGMAFGLLGEGHFEEVSAYIEHLEVMNHQEALIMGQKKAKLQW